MKAPNSPGSVAEDETIAREYDYGDGTVVAIDFGARAGDVTVDVVDGTVIVVAGARQAELDLPGDATEVSANNGVITFE